MKVAILSTSDTSGGAYRAAHRIHTGLRQIGVDSWMVVQCRNSDDPYVLGPERKLAKLALILRPHLERLALRMYRRRKPVIFSPATVPDRVGNRVDALGPDVVNVHWVGSGFLRLESVRRFNRPLVWTLHDLWPMTGGCHFPEDCTGYAGACGSCPILGSSNAHDLSRRVWKRKKRAWDGLNLRIVANSRWVASCVRESSLFGNLPVRVIPNGIDLNLYKPMDKRFARKHLGLPLDRRIILFGALDPGEHRKGFHLLRDALAVLCRQGWGERADLAVFGTSTLGPSLQLGMTAHCLGQLRDDISLSLVYAAADVMVVPSLYETLSLVALEASGCGTPVVAFAATGLLDVVDHRETGYLSEPYRPEDLARGIAWVLEDKGRWQGLSTRSREKAETLFSHRVVANQYREVYEEAVASHKPTSGPT